VTEQLRLNVWSTMTRDASEPLMCGLGATVVSAEAIDETVNDTHTHKETTRKSEPSAQKNKQRKTTKRTERVVMDTALHYLRQEESIPPPPATHPSTPALTHTRPATLRFSLFILFFLVSFFRSSFSFLVSSSFVCLFFWLYCCVKPRKSRKRKKKRWVGQG